MGATGLASQHYKCETAANAREARAALAVGTFDLALLDVHMPGETGIELLASIRVHQPTLAIVMMTERTIWVSPPEPSNSEPTATWSSPFVTASS